MTTRRHFLRHAAAVAGVMFCSCGMLDAAPAREPARKKLPVTIKGKRVKTIDVHCHCVLPETLAMMGLRLEDQRHKQFDDGVRQLEEEGLMQVFRTKHGRDPVVGVVGALQFDVIVSRLENEYGVKSRVEPMNYHAARWMDPVDTDPQSLAGLGANVLDVLVFKWHTHTVRHNQTTDSH